MNPNNELDRQRLIKAIENSTPHPTPPPGRGARKTRLGHIRPAYQITTRSTWLEPRFMHVATPIGSSGAGGELSRVWSDCNDALRHSVPVDAELHSQPRSARRKA
jgi:hypothetical protein